MVYLHVFGTDALDGEHFVSLKLEDCIDDVDAEIFLDENADNLGFVEILDYEVADYGNGELTVHKPWAFDYVKDAFYEKLDSFGGTPPSEDVYHWE